MLTRPPRADADCVVPSQRADANDSEILAHGWPQSLLDAEIHDISGVMNFRRFSGSPDPDRLGNLNAPHEKTRNYGGRLLERGRRCESVSHDRVLHGEA